MQGGQAGEGAADETELRAVTEQGLTEPDVELDPAVLAGLSFTLDGSLCPSDRWPIGEEGYDGFGVVKDEPVSMPTLHLRKGSGTELEAVTYTAATGGKPLVEITPMHRSGLGFVLSDVATCANATYGFEDEWESVRYVPRLLHLVFVRGQDAASIGVVIAASHDAGPLLSTARLDTLPPSYTIIKVDLGRDSLDGYYDGLKKDVVFSEPMPASTQVLIGEQGAYAPIEYLVSAGYVVGFSVNDLLGTGYTMESTSTDLAGNALPSGVMYPGIAWGGIDGSFESPGGGYNDAGRNQCSHVDAHSSSLGSGFGGTTVEVPPLAAAHSFLLGGPDSCSAAFPLARAAEHTHLSFEARLIDFAGTAQPISICISSLGIGEDNVCAEVDPPWVADEAFADAPEGVSEPLEVSLPLPNNATDLWVQISASDHYLWMDSLRTE